MITFYQVDNRKDELFFKLSQNTLNKSIRYGNYIYSTKSYELGKEIAPKGASVPNYAKIVLLVEMVRKAKIGDVIIYLDTDCYVKTFAGLIKYINASHKNLFFISYLTGMVSGSLVGVKVSKEVKKLFANMPLKVPNHTRTNRFGEIRHTQEEEVWNYQIENNINGFNMYVDFMDTTRFGSIAQKELFGNKIFHLQMSNKTEIFHFLKESKEWVYKLLKKYAKNYSL